jgi:acetyltransferase
MSALQALIAPRSIAILGASSDFRKLNGRPLRFLLEKGYRGKIYPVNPKYDRIGELPCYPSVAALPEPADLAIVAVPAAAVEATVRALGARGVRAAVVFSSGFGEMGEEGRALEARVIAAARAGGVRLCGPNCLGLVNAFDGVIATFGQYADGETPAGPVGFVTQSGAFGTAIAALARRRGLGLGYFINTGNEGDVTFSECMREVLEDPRIKVGAGYIEGLKDGAAFAELAEQAMQRCKPLVVTKVGRTGSGARAAASHTGSLAGADAVFDGVVRQLGIARARNEEHMLDIVEAFAYCEMPQGRGLGIITQSGGAGVLMADRAEELGLAVPVPTAETRRRLQEVIPGFGATGNPVDVTGQFVAEPGLLRDSVLMVLEDPQVHVGIVWLQLMDAHVATLVKIFEETKARATKPFVVCWVAAPEQALRELRALGIAVFRGAEPAVDAVAALVGHAAARRAWEQDRAARAAIAVPRLELPAEAGPVATLEAERLLRECGVPTAPVALARNAEEAVAAAERLGYPVALKIESADILHKTEVRGVALRLADAASVRAAFARIVASARELRPQARIDGAIVQRMAAGDTELVLGLQNDPVFGPVVMAGLGGIFVEVLRDVAFARAPVTNAQALEMLDTLRGRAVLAGARGRPALNRERLAELIAAVSRFGAACGPRLAELDLNPVLAGADGAVAVDWLLVMR